MNRFNRLLCLLFAVILSLNVLTVGVFADDTFINNENWREITAAESTEMYNNDGSFVVMYYQNGCFNSSLRKVMIDEWMTTYDTVIHGVDLDTYSMPSWVWDSLAANSVKLPVICIVEDGVPSCFTGDDSMRSIQKRFNEYLGIYDETVISFSEINNTVYDSYSTNKSEILSKYAPGKDSVHADIVSEAESIVSGLTSDEDKLKAIYDWVTTNIYYNYGMLDGTAERYASAIETYNNRNAVCGGFANLTEALCHAVGIPCRVVMGFSTGIGASDTVSQVWALYKQYCSDKDLEAFASDVVQYANHAWNEAFIDGEWVILDTTWGCNNDYYPGEGYITGTPTDKYYDPDIEDFSESHLFWGLFSTSGDSSGGSSTSVTVKYFTLGNTIRLYFSDVEDVAYYTWYVKGPGESSFTPVKTTENEYLFALTEASSGTQIYCIATTNDGEEIASIVSEYRATLSITSEPTSVYTKVGSTAKTTVTAEGAGLTYTWYYKNPGASSFSKSSVTSATYSTSMTAEKSGRKVYCVITDKHGNQVTTNTVSLYVKAAITSQPKTTYTKMGSKVSVPVTAVGNGLTYTWYYKSTNMTSFAKSSVTSSTYTTTMSSVSKDRQVYCIITDKNGNTVKTNTVYLREKVSVTSQPAHAYAASGKTVKTKVTASGDGLTYTWYYTTNGSSSTFYKSSITGATYSTTMNASRDGRKVYCVITDKYGYSVKTSTVTLTQKSPYVISQPKTTYTKMGSKVSVPVTAVGNGLTYTWYFKSADMTSFAKSSVTSSTYTTTMSSVSKNRRVYCIITDKNGNTVKTNTVYLREKVSVTSQPANASAASGKTVKTSVKASGDGLTYTWYYTSNGSTSTFYKSSVTGATYSTTMDASRDGRKVYCVITDKYGYSVKTNTVTLSKN